MPTKDNKDENSVKTLDPLEPPDMTEEEVLEWIFLLDTLNFCFWSDEPTLFTVNYHSVDWTGYRSLCAALARAKEEGIPVHKPSFYSSVTKEQMEHIFRSDSHVQMPMLDERRKNLHEAASVLNQVNNYVFTILLFFSNVFMWCRNLVVKCLNW